MLDSSFIVNFRLFMNDPRGVITCSRDLNGSIHWILQISSLRMGREQHVVEFSNHHLFLKIRKISEGHSYQLVHFGNRRRTICSSISQRDFVRDSPVFVFFMHISRVFPRVTLTQTTLKITVSDRRACVCTCVWLWVCMLRAVLCHICSKNMSKYRKHWETYQNMVSFFDTIWSSTDPKMVQNLSFSPTSCFYTSP